MAQVNDFVTRDRKDKVWRKRLIHIRQAMAASAADLEDLFKELNSPLDIKKIKMVDPDGATEVTQIASLDQSPLLVRAKEIFHTVRVQTAAIRGDLEKLVMTILLLSDKDTAPIVEVVPDPT